MGEAFDAACEGLQDGGQPDLVREIIAKRIPRASARGCFAKQCLAKSALKDANAVSSRSGSSPGDLLALFSLVI
jgi:hypothetical protein